MRYNRLVQEDNKYMRLFKAVEAAVKKMKEQHGGPSS